MQNCQANKGVKEGESQTGTAPMMKTGFCVSVTSISVKMQENPRLLRLYFSTSEKKKRSSNLMAAKRALAYLAP